jgi:hypothetical protein
VPGSKPHEGRSKALTRAQIQRRYRKRKLAAAEAEVDAKRAQARADAAAELPAELDYRVSDWREAFPDIADNSVALLLTDPPYEKAADPHIPLLAVFAKRVLIPGGSLICYTGNTRVSRDMATFAVHLTEQPQLVMIHTTFQQLRGVNIIVMHKPVLHYTKGPRRRVTHGAGPLLPTVLYPKKRDKALFAWGQGDGGIRPLIEHLTAPGELILDPFAGTGRWGEIAHSLGRRWIGSDIVKGGSESVLAFSARSNSNPASRRNRSESRWR